MRNKDERLLVSERRGASAGLPSRLLSRDIPFTWPQFLSLFRHCHYNDGIIDDARWMIIERNARVGNVLKRTPFDMTNFLDFFKTSLPDEKFIATENDSLSCKHEVDGNYNFHIYRKARSTFQALPNYVLTGLGIVLGNFWKGRTINWSDSRWWEMYEVVIDLLPYWLWTPWYKVLDTVHITSGQDVFKQLSGLQLSIT